MSKKLLPALLWIELLISALKATPAEFKQQIAPLEKQQSELIDELNRAMNESVQYLLESNNTEGLEGIKYIQELRKQIEQLETSDTHLEETEANSNLKDTRRAKKLFNVEDMFKSEKGKNHKKHKEKMKNIEVMSAMLKKWALERDLDKKRMDKEKDRKRQLNIHYEKCPKQGYIKKSPGRGGRSKRLNAYPCCRKCCKRSYMGCL